MYYIGKEICIAGSKPKEGATVRLCGIAPVDNRVTGSINVPLELCVEITGRFPSWLRTAPGATRVGPGRLGSVGFGWVSGGFGLGLVNPEMQGSW